MGEGLMGGHVADRAAPSCPVAPVPIAGAGLLEYSQATRRRARKTRLWSIGLKHESRRLKRSITGAVLALFTGPPMQPTDPGFGPGTVLVVDDDEAVRETVAALVTLAGYRVIEAADGEEALHVLHSEPVDVMVMDLRMPRRDGVSVLRDLPLAAPTVIVHTAATGDAAELQTSMLGAKVFRSLGKPVSPSILLAAIGEAIDEGVRSPAARAGGEGHGMLRATLQSGSRWFGQLTCQCGWSDVLGPYGDEAALEAGLSSAQRRHTEG